MILTGQGDDCYRCGRYPGPLHLFALYLDPDPSSIEVSVSICDECIANEGNVVKVGPSSYRVAHPRDLTKGV